MRLDELKPAPGSHHRRKIVGRGIGSGHGAQSTRGMKGQRSRSGFGGMTGFEGGQMPLIRRVPKRGFRHTAFRDNFGVVNIGDFQKLFKAKASVNPASLEEVGLLKNSDKVKVLGTGELKVALTVQAHAFSASAKEKIEKAGGKVEILKGLMATELNNPFGDILKVPELKRRIFFTLAILAAYRVGATIPVPGVNADALRGFFAQQQNTLLGFLNIFSGGAMGRLAIFAMGVGPYINASIIMSLLQGAHVIPYLDRLAKEGQQGQKRMNQITRYLTLALGGLQSFGLALTISKMSGPGGAPIVVDPSAGWIALTVLTLTTGSVFIMWLGEQITERGIGNGVSLIIFTGIVDRLPGAFADLVRLVRVEEFTLFRALFLVGLVLVITGLVVWVETAQRKVPVQYAKRVVGRRMYGGASTYLPLKVDQSGVIAVIFAVSLLAVPMTVSAFFPHSPIATKISHLEQRGSWMYELVYASLIIFFCYFYNSVQFNPVDLADNLRKQGGFIPGIRPGEATANYIQAILEKITLGGALFVAAISVLPEYLQKMMNAPPSLSYLFGGTSILIVVGVALDTIGQIQSHLIMRHYDGFFKGGGGGFKGRWFNVGS